MSQVIVDTDVASYIFGWHTLARRYSDALGGSELILSFMSIAEMRMGAIAAGWGSRRRLLLERFIQGFELAYADNEWCTIWASIRANARAAGWSQPAGRVDRRDRVGEGSASRNEQPEGLRAD